MERSVQIDDIQHKIILSLELIFFNSLSISSLITLAIVCKVWYVYLITSLLFVLSLTYSIVIFVRQKKINSYILKENSLCIKNSLIKTEISYKDIVKITPKKSFVDFILKRQHQTLILHTNIKSQSKITVYFIKEDILDLIDEILAKKKAMQK